MIVIRSFCTYDTCVALTMSVTSHWSCYASHHFNTVTVYRISLIHFVRSVQHIFVTGPGSPVHFITSVSLVKIDQGNLSYLKVYFTTFVHHCVVSVPQQFVACHENRQVFFKRTLVS